MKHLPKNLLALLLILLPGAIATAQEVQEAQHRPASKDQTVTFHFRPGEDLFVRAGNEAELERLYHWIDRNRNEIAEGKLPIHVDGYCASLPTRKENLNLAYLRASRVKSELITKKGLKEAHFITANYPHAYDNRSRDIVVVTIRIAAKAEIKTEPLPERIVAGRDETKPKEHKQQQTTDVAEQKQETAMQPISEAGPSDSAGRYVAVKTNLAAWGVTIMNMAAEVQVGKHVSVELPVLWCPWHISGKHAVKTFTVQPEVRYWLRQPGGGHFFGVHAHAGWFNVLWDKDRYQDTDHPLLGAGISYGYLLPFCKHWAGEFTLGAGYANMRYDTFYNIDNGARIDTRNKSYWGITRVGLSVVYRF